jgi:hypothetical protein
VTGRFTVIHEFHLDAIGREPYSGLVAIGNKLYDTTSEDGFLYGVGTIPYGKGTVYSITP